MSGFIARGEKITIQDMMKMQMDTVDIYARDSFLKMIAIVEGLMAKFNDEEQRGIKFFIQKLKEWDAGHNADSFEAALFNTWQYLFRSHFLMFFEDEQDSIAI